MRLRHLVHADSDSFVVFVASKHFKHKAHVVSRCERCCHNSVFDDLLHSRPIHFMFGYRVGFSWSGVFVDGGSNGAIFDSNKFKMAAAAMLDNFEWPYLRRQGNIDRNSRSR